MGKIHWQVALGVLLVALSAALYLVHYLIFRNAHDIFFYLLHNIGFIPLQILIVTLVIDRMFAWYEKKNLMKKLNMVIGAFFSEVGSELIRQIGGFDTARSLLAEQLDVAASTTAGEFDRVAREFSRREHVLAINAGALRALQEFLKDKRQFMLGLLENPNLLEHEAFTDLLWAVFHLTEELTFRIGLDGLPESDAAHLAGDIKRVYGLIIVSWLSYMKHLKKDYPYLFSLALRMNPFNPRASIIVTAKP